jgi:hypothetical protein
MVERYRPKDKYRRWYEQLIARAPAPQSRMEIATMGKLIALAVSIVVIGIVAYNHGPRQARPIIPFECYKGDDCG